MKAVSLRTEYLINPMPLDIREPRFYWKCEGGQKQTAYRIIASRDGEEIWDTGKVSSSSTTHIVYGGRPLKSRDRVTWKVCLWDENDFPGDFSEGWFEMGLLEPGDWKAQWITGDYTPKRNTRYPVDYFQRNFTLKKTVKKARLYITACGLYRAFLNGERVGDVEFAPGYTDYRKRLQYQAYDVTALLRNKNTLSLELADGWFRGSIGCFAPRNVFGRESKILAQLEITYMDGSLDTLCTCPKFHWSNDGPIRFADMKDGEVYQAGLTPGYRGRAKKTSFDILPTASNNVTPRKKERFIPKLLISGTGQKILDFGQNIAGFIGFTIQGKPGETIYLRCGEMLDENGDLSMKNIQITVPKKEMNKIEEFMTGCGMVDRLSCEKTLTPLQEIRFTCSGEKDHYEMAYAIFGFRYAQIETTVDIIPEYFYSVAVYSDMEETGHFSCSNPLVNQLEANTRWSMKSNFLDVPVDCPTRERLPWTGDAQIFFETGNYMMNAAPFYRKWMADHRDHMPKNGVPSAVVPYCGCDFVYKNTGASAGWPEAVVLVPYRLWKRYGDQQILRENYPIMSRFIQSRIDSIGPKNKDAYKDNPYRDYLYEKGMQLGEWLEPEPFADKIGAGKNPLQTACATAYLHYTMHCMAEIAKELRLEEDRALYADFEEKTRLAFEAEFLKDGTIDTDRQAMLVRPLAFHAVSDEYRPALLSRLEQAIKSFDYHVGTGFLSTPFLLPLLSSEGKADLAYRVLENETSPGWLYEVKCGATTVWENWEGTASRNHYSPGAVCNWLYQDVLGIQVDGENHFLIKPTPGGSLTYACGSYDSIYGKVESEWERLPEKDIFTISVPANTTAQIVLPDGETFTVDTGTYTYEIRKDGYL